MEWKVSQPGEHATQIGGPRSRIYFDPTINLSSLVALLAMLGAGIAAWTSVEKRVSVQEAEMKAMRELLQLNATAQRDAISRIERMLEYSGRRDSEPAVPHARR